MLRIVFNRPSLDGRRWGSIEAQGKFDGCLTLHLFPIRLILKRFIVVEGDLTALLRF